VRQTSQRGRKRLSAFYTPNGMTMDAYRPGRHRPRLSRFRPTLAPLEALREDIVVVSGLGHPQASANGDRPAGPWAVLPAFARARSARRPRGRIIRCGISMDRGLRGALGRCDADPSLELGIDQASLLGSCDINYSCAYTNGISWLSPTVPLPVSANPRDVFERLFGDGEALDPSSRLAQARRQSSILDFVREDAVRLSARLA